MEDECLLGGGYREKSPHQYQTDQFNVRKGDVVVDVGAAEGLFALEVIDQAGKVVVFECDPVWRKPLEATFAPYSSKVQIIYKKADCSAGRHRICFKSFLRELSGCSVFIKMDIEGGETPLVKQCREFLAGEDHVRLCACTYHRENDAAQLENVLSEVGYHTSFSDGFMLFTRDPHQAPPFFRHGLIRAEKQL